MTNPIILANDCLRLEFSRETGALIHVSVTTNPFSLQRTDQQGLRVGNDPGAWDFIGGQDLSKYRYRPIDEAAWKPATAGIAIPPRSTVVLFPAA